MPANYNQRERERDIYMLRFVSYISGGRFLRGYVFYEIRVTDVTFSTFWLRYLPWLRFLPDNC